MNRLNYIIDEINIHIQRVDAILPDIKKWIPVKVNYFKDTDKVKTIDSFIYRFTKIQDKLGGKFFPAVLDKLGEYNPKMPLIDVLNRLERIELIESSDEWIDFRKLRNSLTHEYPDNKKEIIEAINLSITVYEKMKKTFQGMIDYIEKRS